MSSESTGVSQEESPKPVIVYFRMGHVETLEGWTFADGSWGVRIDGSLIGVFPSELNARAQALELAEQVGGVVERLSP